jgi:hypothetical protein
MESMTEVCRRFGIRRKRVRFLPEKETSPVKKREELVAACMARTEMARTKMARTEMARTESMTEICSRFGVARRRSDRYREAFAGSGRPCEAACPQLLDANHEEAILGAPQGKRGAVAGNVQHAPLLDDDEACRVCAAARATVSLSVDGRGPMDDEPITIRELRVAAPSAWCRSER